MAFINEFYTFITKRFSSEKIRLESEKKKKYLKSLNKSIKHGALIPV